MTLPVEITLPFLMTTIIITQIDDMNIDVRNIYNGKIDGGAGSDILKGQQR